MSGPDPDAFPAAGTPTEYRITAHPYILGGAVELRVEWIGGYEAGAWTAPMLEEQIRWPGWFARLLGDTFEARVQRARASLCSRADAYILASLAQREMMARAVAELGVSRGESRPRPSFNPNVEI